MKMSLPGLTCRALQKCLLKVPNFTNFGALITKYSKIWEPDYLIFAETKTPEYDLINVQIKGYDFAILEKYQNTIQRLAKILQIDINKVWTAPQKDMVVHHYKTNSTDIQYEYNLKLYERNVQVVDVKSHIMPLFIETIITTCPPGVSISVHEHEDYMEEDRYIPNLDIVKLQEEYELIGLDQKKKKKKL